MTDTEDGTVPRLGTVRSVTRTFTRDDVATFAALAGDEGTHHVEPDDGQVVVHGLLLAVLPTQLGTQFDFLARTMDYEFHRPAYTAEQLTCKVTTDRVDEEPDLDEMASSAICRNEVGETVMTAEFAGIVPK